jgi:Putative ATP-dependent Lon protease
MASEVPAMEVLTTSSIGTSWAKNGRERPDQAGQGWLQRPRIRTRIPPRELLLVGRRGRHRRGVANRKKILAENYVRPDEAEKVKSTVRERDSLKVIDKVTVTLNEKRDVYEAFLSNLCERIEVPSEVVRRFEKLLVGGHMVAS